jgi:hypothetical protein
MKQKNAIETFKRGEKGWGVEGVELVWVAIIVEQ